MNYAIVTTLKYFPKNKKSFDTEFQYQNKQNWATILAGPKRLGARKMTAIVRHFKNRTGAAEHLEFPVFPPHPLISSVLKKWKITQIF